jgi:hypothetical protein
VERVGAAHRLRAVLLDHLADPLGPIGADMGDLPTSFLPEGLEEATQGRLVPTHAGPHQPAAVVVDDDGQVLVVALVGDLVDPDPPQTREQIEPAGGVGPDPGDDRPDGAPGDPHQLGDRRLGALGG